MDWSGTAVRHGSPNNWHQGRSKQQTLTHWPPSAAYLKACRHAARDQPLTGTGKGHVPREVVAAARANR